MLLALWGLCMYLDVILLGAIIGYLKGGKLTNLGKLPIRGLAWIIALGAIGLLMKLTQSPDKRYLYQTLIMGSSIIMAYFLWINHKLSGFKIIIFGLFLNILVMTLNGGRMPVSEWAAVVSGLSDFLPELYSNVSSRHILLTDNTTFMFLADIIPLPPPYPFPRVLSLGDVFIFGGMIIFMVRGMSQSNKIVRM